MRGSMQKYPLVDVQLAADYICFKASEAGEHISVLKLHKLLYYVQAWHLALYNEPIFEETFEAWVHGPVSKKVFYKYSETKTMYSPITPDDWRGADFSKLTQHTMDHIDSVLDAYMHLSGTQLEQLTHEEEPWIKARGTLSPFERCNNSIDNRDMRDFYSRMIQK
jgi:uncharacterized phage-associated protein